MLPDCTLASAISGLPTTIVATRSGNFSSLARSRTTLISAAAPGTTASPTIENASKARPKPRYARYIIRLSRTLRLGTTGQYTAAERAGTLATSPETGEQTRKLCRPADAHSRRSSLLERIHHLSAEPSRKRLVGDAIPIRHLRLGHVVGPEDQIEHGERGGEILVATALSRRVVPAMEDRPRNDVAEWTESPVEVGVHEGG